MFNNTKIQSLSYNNIKRNLSLMIKPHILFMPKSAYKLRWLVFWTGAPAGLGAYFCYDIPTSIHNSLKTHMDGKYNKFIPHRYRPRYI